MADGRTLTEAMMALLAQEAKKRENCNPHLVTVRLRGWNIDMLVGKGSTITGLFDG